MNDNAFRRHDTLLSRRVVRPLFRKGAFCGHYFVIFGTYNMYYNMYI
jgi:hypothetical protein